MSFSPEDKFVDNETTGSSASSTNLNRIQRSESFGVAALLAAAGGILDAYTYICRGGVFANAQTGNIVLVGIAAANRDARGMLTALMPVVAFIIGVFLTEIIHSKHKKDDEGPFHWRHNVLLMEIGLLIIAALIPIGQYNRIVTTLISAVCAIQVQTFRKVHGFGFASTMCTGNMRSGTEALLQYIQKKDGNSLHKVLCYYGICAIFVVGAFAGGIASSINQRLTLPLAIVLYAAAFLLMTSWEKLIRK